MVSHLKNDNRKEVIEDAIIVEMSKEEAIEEIVVFEDEYPKYIGSTTVVPDPTWENEKALKRKASLRVL